MSAQPKLLLVEDDPLLINLYKTAFTESGYEVGTAFDGETGFEVLSKMEEKPTLILSDLMMPKMNGFELLRKIKSAPELKNIPVVFLTNLGNEEEAKRGLEEGAVTYIVKSEYEPKEVVRKVEAVIAKYGGGNPPDNAS